MTRPNNYTIQAQQAKARFLTYDQDRLCRKFHMQADSDFLYLPMLRVLHRICRTTGNIQRQTETGWADVTGFHQIMTLLDLLCDSREDRYLTGRLKNMTSFGLMFHQNLLEIAKDPWAEAFQENPDGFRRACEALGGTPFPQGDIAYAIELFDGLPVVLQLWFGDEEFPPNLRLLWDENTTMYIRYETMHYARAMLLEQLGDVMASAS